MQMNPVRLMDWLQIIRAEFEEPSGLRVTVEEACTLWRIERAQLVAILDALVQARYLVRTVHGEYFRRPDVPSVDDLPRGFGRRQWLPSSARRH